MSNVTKLKNVAGNLQTTLGSRLSYLVVHTGFALVGVTMVATLGMSGAVALGCVGCGILGGLTTYSLAV